MGKRGLLFVIILLSSCHWQRSWKWDGLTPEKGRIAAVAVNPPFGERENSWTPVLTDLLARRQDVKLVRTNWEYALWVQVEDGYLSLFCRAASGKIVYLAVSASDRYTDRELGRGKPRGTANIMEDLQRQLDTLFSVRKGGRP